jgi:hypothetical protein
MNDRTNAFQRPASKGAGIATVTYLRAAHTRGSVHASTRGEVIMNRIQKAAAAVMALTITVAGAAFVTAPMALADMQPLALHQEVSALHAQLAGHPTVKVSSRHG